MKKSNKKSNFMSVAQVLGGFDSDRDKYISVEFQKYGYDLAVALDDMDHKALYIKMAKNEPRDQLEKAKNFVADANARSKGRLFMWKLAQLKQLKEENRKKVE
jgi:hypothetical protein